MSAPTPVRLVVQVDRILGGCLGVHFPFRKQTTPWRPWRWGLTWAAVYCLAWLAIDDFALVPGISEPRLVSLLAWGGVYFAFAIFFSHQASDRIMDVVRCDILPHASPAYEQAVVASLKQRYPRGRLVLLPLLVAAVSLEAAWWAVSWDLGIEWQPLGWRRNPETLLWAASYFIYFVTAGSTIIAARFYSSFADRLDHESGSFYVLGAADTPVVKGLAKLGTEVLTFWVLIFLLIVSSMLLSVAPPESHRLPGTSLFLFLLVPTTGFFSLGFGTLVYLRTEARIRATLQRFTHEQAAALQKASNALICPGEGRWPAKKDELERLTAWQDRILAGGKYGSRAGATLSIALPLAMPVLSLALKFFGGSG